MHIDIIPRPTVKHPSAWLAGGCKNERKKLMSHESFLKNYLMALLKGRVEKWTKHSGQARESRTEWSLMCNKAMWWAQRKPATV